MTMMISRLVSQRSLVATVTRGQARQMSTLYSKEDMHALFNKQITNEMSASQLYMSASIWCGEKEFSGMGKFMLSESNDERMHAIEFIDFAMKHGIHVKLDALATPKGEWLSIEDMWTDILEAEKKNSQELYTLADAAQDCRDHATTAFLHPFHTEQVQAVDKVRTILAKVKEESHTPGLLRQLDSALGSNSVV